MGRQKIFVVLIVAIVGHVIRQHLTKLLLMYIDNFNTPKEDLTLDERELSEELSDLNEL